ncbi:hypothetical protein J6590_005427 [Homalodisca vitripennis]|nr:hypothetical protein J6590_005427 [Homalodisca vitripennis]
MIRSPISTGFLSSVGLAETWKQFNHGLLNRTFTPDTTCNGRDGTWELDNQKTSLETTQLGQTQAGVSRISKFLSQLQLKLPRVSGYFRLTTQ